MQVEAMISSTGGILSDEWLQSNGVAALVTIVVAIALSVVAKLITGRLSRRIDSADPVGDSLRRTATLTHSLMSAFLTLIWTCAALVVLGEFGVNLGPLVAGAGIAGVAIGFGAQSLVRDGLSGFFILLENQFDLGDTIDAHTTGGVISGRVESFTLRITGIRQYDGTLDFIPNGNIQVVANKSKGWARAIIDIRLAYDEDVDAVRNTLEGLFDELRSEELTQQLKAGPEVLGVQNLAADAVVMRVIADVTPGRRTDVERILRERIASRLAEKGVEVPVVAPKPEAT